ncbi:FAD dependent oxidoreductase [Pholiota conissans]|uniref:FAD dependent oxidoreductase n=1 Tax=Pholiota conissans TaxID=109636 RepID=A0A9P6D7B1_9AGAR|nr:FAD dependent oxidoreductase [Pholiota conissans]
MATRQIVIIGGGIIGCTTAYYLSRHSSTSSQSIQITLLEASEHGPAQGASGKAGGLVARWAYPKEIVDLSFNEHVKLADEHNGKDRWGWRYVGCGSWEGRGELVEQPSEDDVTRENKSLEKTLGLPGGQKPAKAKRKTGLPEDLQWVKEELTDSYTPMAKHGATAQVHPYLFTTSMFQLAKDNGVACIHGKAVAILQESGAVTGVEYLDPKTGGKEIIPATQVVLAAGAWSPNVVPNLPISSMRAHSITFRPRAGVNITPYVLFTEILAPTGSSSPEIYARPDNEVYACGTGDDAPLPPSVDEVAVDEAACALIQAHVTSISQELREGVVEKRQACYLSLVSTGGGPIVGEAKHIASGLFIGTGHTCWGISNAPGTAKALTELIMDGQIKSANLKKLDPSVILL